MNRAASKAAPLRIVKPADPIAGKSSSIVDLRATVRKACELSQEYFAENFWTVRDMHSGEWALMQYNAAQRYFHDRKTGEDVILKARQYGYTTYFLSEAYHAAAFMGWRCAVITHKMETTIEKRQDLEDGHDMLPDWLRPETVKTNIKELRFTNGGVIRVFTAGGKEIARGTSLEWVLMSEAAFYDNLARTMASVSAAQENLKISRCYIETTGNGFNAFKKLWDKAVKGTIKFEAHFIADTKFRKRTSVWIKKQLELLGELFNQEYPETPKDAFIASGACTFSQAALDAQEENMRPSIAKRFHIDIPYTMFEEPVPGVAYAMGIDSAEGAGQTSAGDDLALDIWKEGSTEHPNPIQVASIAGFYEPHLMAEWANRLGEYFNEACAVVEINGVGMSIADQLYHHHDYPDMYFRKILDQKGFRLGFRTSGATKPLLLGELRKRIAEGSLQINDPETITDCRETNAVDHTPDRVMAMALSMLALKDGIFKRDLDYGRT